MAASPSSQQRPGEITLGRSNVVFEIKAQSACPADGVVIIPGRLPHRSKGCRASYGAMSSTGGPTYPGGQWQGRPAGPPHPAAPAFRADAQPPDPQPQRQLPTASRPPRRTFELVPVRRRDVVRLRQAGPPVGVVLPPTHGDEKDPRYPSPKGLWTTIGFLLDLALHVGAAVGVFRAVTHVPRLADYVVALAVAAFLVLSIVHRIFVQWAFRTTLGKGLVGLCLIRDDTGGRPTLWSLVKAWLFGALAVVGTLSS
jgi:hypothetical protein